MDIEVEPYAILILEILDERPRHVQKINGPALLSILKERTKDYTLQPNNVKDAVAILREGRAVRVNTAMDPLSREYGFNVVWITPLGRNYLKARKVSQAFDSATGAERARGKKLLFFSYSSKDSKKVGEICDILEKGYNYDVFKAHDTIKVTQEWRAKIKENLDNCDGLVAYITRNFRGSEWTYQECGWVAGRKVPIYPLFIMKKIPDGFIEERQGTRISDKTDAKVIAQKINETFKEI